MRLFVAVHLPEEIRERLAAVQDRLRAVRADVSWVRPGNIHLTLKFLGEVEPARQEGIRAALREVARGSEPCEAAVAGVGSFGGRIPRVIWAGITGGAEALGKLAGRVDAAMAGVGFSREKRPFAPHLTLGRVRSPRKAAELLAALRAEAQADLGATRVTAIFLMESQLNPQGSIYTVVERFLLGPR
ncbi:MAG: RNA 2',3'-cyclic phosphodiesterase [candidate division NC10 bacterium]|nr:RNA 2',3'-cyclic phosphodiesterase [candidate division NC10 bacterium]